MKYQMKMGAWQWPHMFNTYEEAREEAMWEFRRLFAAHRYYVSEPHRYRTWAGLWCTDLKVIDRQADTLMPGFARVVFTIMEVSPDDLQKAKTNPSRLSPSVSGPMTRRKPSVGSTSS